MPVSRSIFAMRFLVLAALAAVVAADVSHLAGINNAPASSYGVPQNSVTENFLRAVPTSPPLGLNLPSFEHQDFNAQLSLSNPGQFSVVSSTPAPIVSSTPVPSLESVVSTTPTPSFLLGSGYSYTTPVPDLSLNSGFVSSTPAPNVVLTSGSQELLSPQLQNFNFNNLFSTSAPLVPTTPAPVFNSGLNFGSGLNYNFGLSSYPTPLPYLGNGAFDAGLNVHALQGSTSGGSLNDAFGVSSGLSQAPQVSKHVYFYAAPEDPEPPRTRVHISPVPPPKKNIRILFIKAPAPPAPAPIRIEAPPQNQEKTIVYVLVKKPEEQQDIEIQTPPSTPPPKPEVYFIKYNNHQEAEQAISQVQNGQDSSAPQLIANNVGGDDILSTINKESVVPSLPPLVNYIQSTTTASPPLNFGGSIIGPGFNGGFINPQDNDINSNLIYSGGQISSLFSTGAPVTVSSGDIGLFGTSTIAPPVGPHVTYGPPILKK